MFVLALVWNEAVLRREMVVGVDVVAAVDVVVGVVDDDGEGKEFQRMMLKVVGNEEVVACDVGVHKEQVEMGVGPEGEIATGVAIEGLFAPGIQVFHLMMVFRLMMVLGDGVVGAVDAVDYGRPEHGRVPLDEYVDGWEFVHS